MLTLPLYNDAGKEIESIKLDAAVFDGEINAPSIYQAINAFRANQRMGLAATKTRGEVSGGGRKPWKQKGTGRARVGSTRSPLWRHGGVTFGPHLRDFSYLLPKKIKLLALKSSLNVKASENNLILIDNFNIEKPKTKEALKIFRNLKIVSENNKSSGKVLLLLKKENKNLILALRNLNFLHFNLATDTCAYEILAHKKIIITKEALNDLTVRLSAVKSKKGPLNKALNKGILNASS